TFGRGAWKVTNAAATLVASVVPAQTDNRYWFTIQGTNLGGSLTLGSFVSATVSGVSINFNTFGGAFDPDGAGAATTQPAAALDWQHRVDLNAGAATFSADPVILDIPGGSPITLNLTSGGLHLRGALT